MGGVGKREAGEWVEGWGWDEATWGGELPDLNWVDCPSNPVIVSRLDDHMVLANEAALSLAGITEATPDPPGGRIARTPDGRPSGLLACAHSSLRRTSLGKKLQSPQNFESAVQNYGNLKLNPRCILLKASPALVWDSPFRRCLAYFAPSPFCLSWSACAMAAGGGWKGGSGGDEVEKEHVADWGWRRWKRNGGGELRGRV